MWVHEEIHGFHTLLKTKPVFLFCFWFMLNLVFSLSLAESAFGSMPVCLVLFLFGCFLYRDLSNNQISELASDAFQGLRSLNSLWVM